ncbi:MAG: shikimate kinase [Candidatus Omnitrophica bacterium]|nr:shikimate kinase [Candidatus Omnitrophota bacterium]
MKNIYLVGMMGSGKTTSGKALAKLLSLPFVDLDDQIIGREGKSINEIFQSKGEPHFREIETELLFQVSERPNQVVATGGGIVINALNRERMKNTGIVVYLKTSLDILWERVREKKDRPLLQSVDPKKSLADLFYSRTPLYEETADKIFLTDHKSSEAVALEIYKTCFERI